MEVLSQGAPNAKADHGSKELKPVRRRSWLLRRLVPRLSTSSATAAERGACPANATQLDMMDKLDKMDKPQQALHRPQSCGGLLWALTPSDGAASPTISKWTPPLSPTSSGNRSGKGTTPRAGVDLEKRPSAAEAVAMLKRSGVPALEGVKMLRHMVGAAPRAWIRDFKIRGGRAHVNAKLREMTALEGELNNFRPRASAVIPKFLRRRASTGSQLRLTSREIAEAREELLKVVLFLHLRH